MPSNVPAPPSDLTREDAALSSATLDQLPSNRPGSSTGTDSSVRTASSSSNVPASSQTGGSAPPGVPSANSNNAPDNVPGNVPDKIPDYVPPPPSGTITQGSEAVPLTGNNVQFNIPAPPPAMTSGNVPSPQGGYIAPPNQNMFPSNMPAPPPGTMNDPGLPNLPAVPSSEKIPLPPPVNGGQMFPPDMPPPPPGAFNDAPVETNQPLTPQRNIPAPPPNGMFPPNMPPPPPGAFADQPSVPGSVPGQATFNIPSVPVVPPQGVPQSGDQDEAIANMYPESGAVASPNSPNDIAAGALPPSNIPNVPNVPAIPPSERVPEHETLPEAGEEEQNVDDQEDETQGATEKEGSQSESWEGSDVEPDEDEEEYRGSDNNGGSYSYSESDSGVWDGSEYSWIMGSSDWESVSSDEEEPDLGDYESDEYGKRQQNI